MPVLVDSNIIIDILTQNTDWYDWSFYHLNTLSQTTDLIINPIIWTEISIAFQSEKELINAIPSNLFIRETLPWEACFLTGQRFKQYRIQNGKKTSPLPDFFIGAHAEVKEYRLLTRDKNRYQTYFPEVSIICP